MSRLLMFTLALLACPYTGHTNEAATLLHYRVNFPNGDFREVRLEKQSGAKPLLISYTKQTEQQTEEIRKEFSAVILKELEKKFGSPRFSDTEAITTMRCLQTATRWQLWAPTASLEFCGDNAVTRRFSAFHLALQLLMSN